MEPDLKLFDILGVELSYVLLVESVFVVSACDVLVHFCDVFAACRADELDLEPLLQSVAMEDVQGSSVQINDHVGLLQVELADRTQDVP